MLRVTQMTGIDFLRWNMVTVLLKLVALFRTQGGRFVFCPVLVRGRPARLIYQRSAITCKCQRFARQEMQPTRFYPFAKRGVVNPAPPACGAPGGRRGPFPAGPGGGRDRPFPPRGGKKGFWKLGG